MNPIGNKSQCRIESNHIWAQTAVLGLNILTNRAVYNRFIEARKYYVAS
uniref:Uncharacterized protein n=1 Tax=Arundo donax TaxID=35708 RepID=A0A0A9F2Y7_ARUDO